jgi:hypothetical protein
MPAAEALQSASAKPIEADERAAIAVELKYLRA